MIDLTIHRQGLEHNLKKARENNILKIGRAHV